jgi:2-methylcitrate dehydratase PrpD
MLKDPGEMVAERVLEVWENPSSRALEEARRALIDTVAVASSALRLEALNEEFVKANLQISHGREAPILGLWKWADFMSSIAVNSFLSHSIEYDDWLRPGYVHAGSVIVPVALAAATMHDLTLEDVLRAIIAGYEAAALIGAYLGRSHYQVYHTTATAGSAGAGVAYNLLSYRGETLREALLISFSYMGGLWSAPRDPRIKPFSAAKAAVSGVYAARAALVGSGLTYNMEEACKLLRGECNIEILRDPPWEYAILENGYKLYPSCRHTHTAIDAALELWEKVRDSDIVEVQVHTYRAAVGVASRWPVRDKYNARFSMEYLIALTLIRGVPTMKTIEENLENESVRRLADKIKVAVDPELDTLYPELMPARVIVRTRTRILQAEKHKPRGDPGTIDAEVLLEKARMLSMEAGDPRIAGLTSILYESNSERRLRELLEQVIR